MQEVTESYLAGIKEGRAFMAANPGLSIASMESCLDNARANVAQNAAAMREIHAGERDFWINQIKKARDIIKT